jgi:hypothetical protein
VSLSFWDKHPETDTAISTAIARSEKQSSISSLIFWIAPLTLAMTGVLPSFLPARDPQKRWIAASNRAIPIPPLLAIAEAAKQCLIGPPHQTLL